MIVRILGEGQYLLEPEAVERINELDGALEVAVDNGDEAQFRSTLTALVDGVRSLGTPHDPESLDESDVILPAADASLEEVRAMLGDEGLIPG